MVTEFVAGATAVLAMLVSVVIHLAALELILRWVCIPTRHLTGLMIGVPLLMLSHVVQVGVFGAGLWALHAWYGPEVGELSGGFTPDPVSVWYFSASVFTTVGFGDIVATGAIRVFVGLEAIAGLVLITWSASFTFLGMQMNWRSRVSEVEAALDR
ncbi:MAG: ion channel [Planctomycetota bacterium]